MLTTVIAVIGTLAGAIVAGLLQHRTARTARDEARDDHRRDKELEAVTAFASAVAAHRRAMVIREELRLSGADADQVAAARAESHTTRSAIEAPKVLVSILAPGLAQDAEAAARASYALRGAADPDTLNSLREAAITAADHFTAAAARHFA
ncbi:protein kilB [Streptomyces ipomoeae]|uniref:protein kilB n=1 Tax=Streptomyces ipomoeae TaxID=103232 RepID=UPI0029A348E4|nr:protein kilB [Streptomyces ipomoeae]MDX2695945.1 protein kilB [Streptomyces ipomoeae]MDX2843373.1 protein kilB [Streptomyces ipomoeae]